MCLLYSRLIKVIITMCFSYIHLAESFNFIGTELQPHLGETGCTSREDCWTAFGTISDCNDGVCVCPQTDEYGIKLANSTMSHACPMNVTDVLGEACRRDADCFSLPDSRCNQSLNVCVCRIGFIETYNKKKCVRVATELHQQCAINKQCRENLPSASCYKNRCECSHGFHEVDGRCWKTAVLDKTCSSNESCIVMHSWCTKGFCDCEPGYISHKGLCLKARLTDDKSRCLADVQCQLTFGDGYLCRDDLCRCDETSHHLVTSKGELVNINTTSEPVSTSETKCFPNIDLRRACGTDAHCSHFYGEGVVCRKERCQCDDFHHMTTGKTHCVMNVGLNEVCAQHEECYQPGIDDRRMFCVGGVCKCMESYVDIDGICVGGALSRTPSIGILMLILICLAVTSPF